MTISDAPQVQRIRRRRPLLRAAVLALALTGALSACAAPAETEPSATAERSGSGEVRHDLEPLTDRFPLFAPATTATWMSGTLGDDRVPGPSSYWIDAVVTLPESDFEALRTQTDAQASTDTPSVEQDLETALPSGPFLRSDALDAAFSEDGRSSAVFLDEETDSVVLTSRFQDD